MKTAALLATLVLAPVVSGCGVEVLTTAAIQGELQAQQATALKGQLSYASDSTSKMNLQHAIDAYRADTGLNPPNLEALVPEFIASIPTRADGRPYGYDPTTGQLTDNAAITPEDYQTMEAIKEAINRYGTAVGYYPPTLDDLAPDYLPAPPRTSSGQLFVYNNQNGYVAHPASGGGGPRPAATGGMGLSPMGEAMTGIGIQNQLSSGGGGASSAGSRMRSGAGNIADGYNAQQEQALNALGY